jgi:diguanylate cyclase (GGDEF)-like protein
MPPTLLDAQTMLFMNVLVGICLSLALSFSIRDRFICPGAKYWLAGMYCSTIGMSCLWLRLYIPLTISVVIGNGLIVLSYTQIWLGLRQYNKSLQPRDRWIMLFAPFTSLVLIGMLIYDSTNITLRILFLSSLLICLLMMSIWQALKNRKTAETGRLFLVFTLSIIMIGNIIRVLTASKLMNNTSLFDNNLSNILLMANATISLLGMGFSVLLISSQWLQQRLYIHATYDALTGVYNRYALIELGATLELTTNLSSRLWSLAIIDIDHFKQVNDQYGHPVGDVVLKQIAASLKTQIRHRDIIARYGGEEFVVVLPDTALEHTRQWADRVRHHIATTPLIIDNHTVHITVSIGIAASDATVYKLNEVLKLADSALYKAKNAGRNQVQSSM